MEEKMTIRQVLEITAEALGAIQVPVRLQEQIAEPIRRCIGNLQLCMEAMDRQKEAAGGARDA